MYNDGKICENCDGGKQCNKYCIIRYVYSFIEMMNSKSIVHTKISSLDRMTRSNKPISVIGYREKFEEGESIQYSIKVEDFNECEVFDDDEGLIEIVTDFINECDDSLEIKKQAKEVLERFMGMKNHLYKISDIHLNDKYEIYKDDTRKVSVSALLNEISWKLNRDNHEVEDCVKLKVNMSDKIYETRLSKLGIEYEREIFGKERELLERDRCHLFKPIKILLDKQDFVIDCKYIYSNEHVIGIWSSSGMRMIRSLVNDEKFISIMIKNKEALLTAKEFMGAYGIVECNVIDMRDGEDR